MFDLVFCCDLFFANQGLIFLKMVIADGIGPALTRAIGAIQINISLYTPKSLFGMLKCKDGNRPVDSTRKKNSVCRVSRTIKRVGGANYMKQFGLKGTPIPDDHFQQSEGVISVPLDGGISRKLDKYHDVIDEVLFTLMDDEMHAKVARTKMGVEIIRVGPFTDNSGMDAGMLEWKHVISDQEASDGGADIPDNMILEGDKGWRVLSYSIQKRTFGTEPKAPVSTQWKRLQFSSQLYSDIREFFLKNPAPEPSEEIPEQTGFFFSAPDTDALEEDATAELFIELERDAPDFGAVVPMPKVIPMVSVCVLERRRRYHAAPPSIPLI